MFRRIKYWYKRYRAFKELSNAFYHAKNDTVDGIVESDNIDLAFVLGFIVRLGQSHYNHTVICPKAYYTLLDDESRTFNLIKSDDFAEYINSNDIKGETFIVCPLEANDMYQVLSRHLTDKDNKYIFFK